MSRDDRTPTLSGTDQVHSGIKHQILTGVIDEDAVLYEASVGGQFGVSRTPVREAFARLVDEGLLTRRKRGYGVVRTSLSDITEIFDMRVILESAAAEFCARRCSDFDLAELDELNERATLLLADRGEETPPAEVVDELLRLNQQWHLGLARSTNHGYLHKLIESVMARQAMYNLRMRIERVSDFRAALDAHIALVDALRTHDAAVASQIAKDHLKAENARRLAVYVRNTQNHDN